MNQATWISLIGSLAGICTATAFVPQVIKVWRQGGRDLSYGMLGLFLTGASLWFTYGVLLGAWAIIFANGATGILIAIATVLKARAGRRDSGGDHLAKRAAERA
jgi:MtN3 and saliva related transmembrane protein